MTVPAWTTNGEGGLTSRSALVVRRSTDALTKASFRSCPFWANASSDVVVEFEGISVDDATADGRTLVLANTLLVRAASLS